MHSCLLFILLTLHKDHGSAAFTRFDDDQPCLFKLEIEGRGGKHTVYKKLVVWVIILQ